MHRNRVTRKRFWTAVLLLLLLVAALSVLLRDRDRAATVEPRRPQAGATLPCAAYREHRKEVKGKVEIPTLGREKAVRVKVLEVTDGDTLVVQKGGERVRVRLMGMDTPERTKTRNGQIEHYAEEASRFAEQLVKESGWEVSLTYDQVTQDKYGRDLGYVWLKDGRLLNAVMVAEGYAYSYTSSPKPKYVDLFLALMREARAQEKGLWGVCP